MSQNRHLSDIIIDQEEDNLSLQHELRTLKKKYATFLQLAEKIKSTIDGQHNRLSDLNHDEQKILKMVFTPDLKNINEEFNNVLKNTSLENIIKLSEKKEQVTSSELTVLLEEPVCNLENQHRKGNKNINQSSNVMMLDISTETYTENSDDDEELLQSKDSNNKNRKRKRDENEDEIIITSVKNNKKEKQVAVPNKNSKYESLIRHVNSKVRQSALPQDINVYGKLIDLTHCCCRSYHPLSNSTTALSKDEICKDLELKNQIPFIGSEELIPASKRILASRNDYIKELNDCNPKILNELQIELEIQHKDKIRVPKPKKKSNKTSSKQNKDKRERNVSKSRNSSNNLCVVSKNNDGRLSKDENDQSKNQPSSGTSHLGLYSSYPSQKKQKISSDEVDDKSRIKKY